jgi:hypothetical protein
VGIFLRKDGVLAFEFRLAVDIGGLGSTAGFVGCFALRAWKDVVGRYVDQEGIMFGGG